MKLLQQVDLQLLKEKILENKLYAAVWVVTLLTIIVVNTLTASTYKFVGETDSKEVNINSRHAVVIKGINVISGQFVKQGQLLVELERKDLTKLINEVTFKLEELRAQYKLNSELNANINSIKKYKKLSKSKKQILEQDEDVLSIQIKNLEKELSLLLKEQEALYIFSQFDGHIGFVNFKIGESVSPFTPILTMHKKTPSFVRGYIHENLSNQVAEGKKVYVNSLSSKQRILAEVKSVGTRIIEFPERFRRTPEIKVWGREVMIELPAKNSFLLGEKVFIEVAEEGKVSFLNQSVASDSPLKKFSYEIIPIKRGELTENLIEPSGIVYVEDLNKYMMISDDNYDHKPYVYLLNQDGTIDPHVVVVEGVDEIKDMESITSDEEGFIYITSSQSKSRNGKLSDLRRKFIKLERSGVNLKKVAEVHLFTLLNNLAVNNPRAKWAKLLRSENKDKFEIEIDVEGVLIHENTAYLGLRNNVGNKHEVAILKIEDIKTVFNKNKLGSDQVSIFRKLTLPVNRRTDRYEGISDLFLKDNQLFIVTANNKFENVGRILKTSFELDGPIQEVKHFSNHRPEGITYDVQKDELIIVFDNNDDNEPLVMSTLKME